MPSRLSPSGRVPRLQNRGLARQVDPAKNETARGPWRGRTPGLPQQLVDYNFFRNTLGIVARPAPTALVSTGEVLTHDDGWARIDNTRLPLGTDATGGVATAIVNTVIVRLQQFPRTNSAGSTTGQFDKTPIALVAGDGSTADTFSMWRINPVTSQWERVTYDTAGGSAAGGPVADRDGATDALASMPDSAVFPEGAPARSAFTGAIDEPCFIWTNNVDPVMVYPGGTGDTTTFEHLTDRFNEDFRCVSLAAFKSRMYYFNTFETNTRYPRRLRRSARNTADPLETTVGAGFIEEAFNQFSGQGVRVEPFADVLACYFEDGTSFITETGIATIPNAVRNLDNRRGLLGTHALTPIGDGRHFGIFTDGWWLLDRSGRWEEAGTANIQGVEMELWKADFYEKLDITNRHKIQVHYDQPKNWVRIAFPTSEAADADQPDEVWIYEIDAGRCWRDRYHVTCWGHFAQAIVTATLWSTVSGTWSTILGSWASLAGKFGLTRPVHADSNGLVYGHSIDIITRDGVNPSYLLETSPRDFGENRFVKCADRLWLESLNVNNVGSHTLTVLTSDGRSESKTLSLDIGDTADWGRARADYRLLAEDLGWRISGTGPVIFRSVGLDYTDELVDSR